jgi:hypothetical protein
MDEIKIAEECQEIFRKIERNFLGGMSPLTLGERVRLIGVYRTAVSNNELIDERSLEWCFPEGEVNSTFLDWYGFSTREFRIAKKERVFEKLEGLRYDLNFQRGLCILL